MEPTLYDIYFTGQLIEGIERHQAQANLAKLFNISQDKAAQYFTGKPRILKRGLDKNGALKYKQALHSAGMLAAFKQHELSVDENRNKSAQTLTPSTTDEKADSGISLAPVGSDVLPPNERTEFIAADIDTSDIKLASAFGNVETQSVEAPPAPDTSHLSAAVAGEDLLVVKPLAAKPPELNLDSISLAPAGTELEELQEDLPKLNPDISALSIAPAGANLQEGVSKKQPPPPPNTDHLNVD